MTCLKPTDLYGEITYLGRVREGLASRAETELHARFDGVDGETHAGLTRESCSRVTKQYPRGTIIRNTRQFSILGEEEMDDIAAAMGIPVLEPELVGASMVLRGIPDFSHVPPGTRLQAPSGATLVVDLENLPCHLPARVIEGLHSGFGGRFKLAAKDRRGITAWVEREGVFRLGDPLRLHIPNQRVWHDLAAALAL